VTAGGPGGENFAAYPGAGDFLVQVGDQRVILGRVCLSRLGAVPPLLGVGALSTHMSCSSSGASGSMIGS
jgi:hypothetical protein